MGRGKDTFESDITYSLSVNSYSYKIKIWEDDVSAT